jgi:Putative adhesin
MLAESALEIFERFPTAILLFLCLTAISPVAAGQQFSKTFSVSSDQNALEVINQQGSIKVTAAGANSGKVVINARHSDGNPRVDAKQNPDGKIIVEVSGRGSTDFEISVPTSTQLDLLTYKGMISVVNLNGPVRARTTTEGDIRFANLRSQKVEGHSISGNVFFDGEALPGGEYKFKSFSGKIDVTLPPDADFRLSATSSGGVIDLGGFPLKFDRQTNQLIEAACRTGKSRVSVWTQEGSIHLHRKP